MCVQSSWTTGSPCSPKPPTELADGFGLKNLPGATGPHDGRASPQDCGGSPARAPASCRPPGSAASGGCPRVRGAVATPDATTLGRSRPLPKSGPGAWRGADLRRGGEGPGQRRGRKVEASPARHHTPWASAAGGQWVPGPVTAAPEQSTRAAQGPMSDDVTTVPHNSDVEEGAD